MPTVLTTLAQPLCWVDSREFDAAALLARAKSHSSFAEAKSQDVTEREKCVFALTSARSAAADDHIRCAMIGFAILC